ncbi:DUF3025 domain-containing protein [Paraliomyxa miuraensis]|uniref:DUF3025 domain-containing protein n=1 Tax=Paraliomyxa miuraensis TaxID=376150 RepID=UPI00224FC288|nr:DUF3025 domain-containing protein [Paraliomyxa miuraensis]MCX4240318.1 DUF3025 domain-containing protein [Paraliomyxa miuraensis]
MDPSPWRRHRALAVLAEAWPPLAAPDPPSRDQLDRWLAASGSRWRLAGPDEAKASAGYEAAVVAGTIPTREGSWHDTFNVLSFIAFPRTKHALHRRYLELQHGRRDPTSGRLGNRGREEDALALLDEASIVLAALPEAIEPLERARREGTLEPLDHAVRSHGARAYVLGHALLEHLVLDRGPIGAGVITLAVGALTRSAVDLALARRIEAGGFPHPQVSPTVPWPSDTVDAWMTT